MKEENEFLKCPGYLLSSKSVDNLVDKIRNESEKREIKNNVIIEKLDDQKSIIKKLFDKIDDNKKENDSKWKKLNGKLLVAAGSFIIFLIGIIGTIIWKFPDFIEWLKILIN